MSTPQPMNLCRQFRSRYCGSFKARADAEPQAVALARSYLRAAEDAKKFVLPAGGALYEDPEFRAVSDLPILRLPFPLIALEFVSKGEGPRLNKHIAFAQETGPTIVVGAVRSSGDSQPWTLSPCVVIPTTGYVNRVEGESAPRFFFVPAPGWREITGKEFDANALRLELYTLMSLLNFLSCSNTAIRCEPARKAPRSASNPLPFDSYHYLDVVRHSGRDVETRGSSTDRRAPREHVRRGHIRRLGSGERVWINHCIVNPKISAGQIDKAYRVTA